MKNIEYFFELIQKSDISLLGYRFKQERLKDEIISKLPHLVVPEINSSFSFKSFLRDLKLQSILETSDTVNNPEYLVLDLNNIKFDTDSYNFTNSAYAELEILLNLLKSKPNSSSQQTAILIFLKLFLV